MKCGVMWAKKTISVGFGTRLIMPLETILAYVFGNRQDIVFIQLRALLEPFGITRFFCDDWGAYERHLPSEQRIVGKRNTQMRA